MKEIDKVIQKASDMEITTTKFQYEIIARIMNDEGLDITPQECKYICNLQRYCRMALAKDEVALELEKQWHNTQVTREAESWDKMFRHNALDA